jgi:hypothetical protein
MQHNSMLLANVEIEQAQLRARARAERRAGAQSGRAAAFGLLALLRRR